ncbi:Peptidase C1A papain C-terminal [Arabidopsis suecica]|nr:Peptidase C1A papain C-terminal [Arabidopsis suecica]
MTNSEFKAHFLGLNTSSLRLHKKQRPVCDPAGNVPDAVDWRTQGAVTPIRNQGKCGGCWAFSAVAAIEGINKIKTGNLVSLSEQQLIDCDVGTYNKGCSGGLMETAFEFIKTNGGLATETDYPYTGIEGTCDQEKSKNKVVTIQGYQKVAQNEASLQIAAAQQPVSVGIDAGGFIFQLYSSGVFTNYCGTNLNHGVTVVGYGVEGDQKYWIVKNSWGTGWGEEGYIRMERGVSEDTGKCGIAMMASYPLQ